MKTLLATILVVFSLSLAGLFVQTAHATFDPTGEACLQSGGKSSVCADKSKSQDATGNNSLYGKDGILSKAITILDIVIGAASVIMIIIGGFKFVLSGGDASNVNSARNTVLYAIIGVVIAVSGQIIVKFVLNRL
ncbi:MAG: hypothetical protein ACXWLH_02255 [Candidatus Saccharimonadales bacterium]